MNKINVLVVDSEEKATKEIEKYFNNHETIKIVATKHDGEEALEYIINNVLKFDLIILDILLAKIDGLFLLSELKRRKIDKKIIITTSLNDETLITESNMYGVNYYMLKPINYMSLEHRILKNLESNRIGMLTNVETTLTELLHSLGIPSNIRGFQYIRDSILIIYNQEIPIAYITKDVYPELSKKYDTTPSRVERAIRHAIEVSWTRGDIKLIDEIFGNSIDMNKDRPSNFEYISTIADRLRVYNNPMYT